MNTGPHRDMPPAALPIDPVTGRVAVQDKLPDKNGNRRVRWLHAVDAREQLARSLGQEGGCVLAGDKVAPRNVVGKPLVDWTGMPLEQLREHAQDAGVAFTARTRKQIEDDLREMGHIPSPEEDDEGDE